MRPYTIDTRSNERRDFARMPHPNAWRIRVSALLALLRVLLVLSSIVFFAMGFFGNEVYTIWAAWTLGAGVLAIILFYLFATNLFCKVCANPVILVTKANKSRKAKKFLDVSYGLAVAMPALFRGHFLCMYCGSKVRLKKDTEQDSGRA